MSNADYKNVEALTPADLERAPVWQFVHAPTLGDTVVRPMKRLPIQDLSGKVVGSRVRLANGSSRWALLGNVKANKPDMTEHFLTLSIEDQGRWFHLARYHDPGYEDQGPQALAAFLGLPADDVFPISYDITGIVEGHPAALKGKVEMEPKVRLTRAQIIAMAVPKRSEL